MLATSSLEVESLDCPGIAARRFQNLGEPGISSSTPKPQCRHRSVRSRRSPNLRRCCATMPRGFLHRGHGTRPITPVKIRMLARNTPIPTNSRTLPLRCHESAYPCWRRKSKSHYERVGVAPLQVVTKSHFVCLFVCALLKPPECHFEIIMRFFSITPRDAAYELGFRSASLVLS